MKNEDINTLRMREALIPLFILILALASYFTSNAQSVTVGPKLGFTSTTGAGDDIPDNVGNRSGVVGGGFVKFNSTGIVAVQPELLYHGKGGTWHPLANAEYRININYLELPVLVKLQLPLSDMFYPNIYAGPYAAFTMSHVEEGEFFFFSGTNDEPNINDFDWGAVVGGGMDMMFGRFLVGVDARYGMGQLNIYDEPDTDEEPDIKNRSFTVAVNLGFTL